MPRISHKKATTLSCVVIDEDHTTGLAQQVADILNEELRSNGSDGSSSITSTCTVSAAVKRLLPLVTCPLQPQDLLQRCALLHLPDVSPAPMHAAEGSVVCVATAAAACTVMWSLMLEGVGDIVQRGILKIFGGYSYRQTVEKAGGLVLLHVALQKQQQQGEEAEVASSPGLPASIDLLLCDDIGRKLVTSHMHHVINLLCSAAGQVLYCHGTRLVNSEISSTGIRMAAITMAAISSQSSPPSSSPFLHYHQHHHCHHHHDCCNITIIVTITPRSPHPPLLHPRHLVSASAPNPLIQPRCNVSVYTIALLRNYILPRCHTIFQKHIPSCCPAVDHHVFPFLLVLIHFIDMVVICFRAAPAPL